MEIENQVNSEIEAKKAVIAPGMRVYYEEAMAHLSSISTWYI